MEAFQKLVAMSPQGITQVDDSGRNFVHYACFIGRLDMLEVILDNSTGALFVCPFKFIFQ